MAAGKYNFIIEQGATFTRQVTWKDSSGAAINLTGYTIAGKIRKNYSDNVAIATLTCTVTNAASGIFTFSLTATQTAALFAGGDTVGVYDIEATTGSTVYRVLEGVVNIKPEATR